MAVQELRHAARSLRRSPLFAAACVLVLALGIAANTAAFSVVHTLVKRPLPFPHAQRLALAGERNARSGVKTGVSLRTFQVWRDANAVFEETGAMEPRPFNAGVGAEPESVPGAYVTAGFLRVLGLQAALGRTLADSDQRPGAAPVALVGQNYWRTRLDADPSAIGRTLTVDGQQVTVIGVLPRIGRSYYASYAVWMPLIASPARAGDDQRALQVAGRLKPGVTFAQAEANLAALLPPAAGAGSGDWSSWVLPMADSMKGAVPLYAILLTAVLLLLALVCANMAAMQLARAAGRQKEIAIRLALGAGRSRVVRQLLTEGFVLAGAGGALGFALTAAARRVLIASVPELADLQFDWSVALYAALVSMAAGLFLGLSPALSCSRPDMNTALKATGRLSGLAAGKRVRGLLVVSEFAVAVTLLASVGLLMRGFVRLRAADTGFRTGNLLAVSLSAPAGSHSEPEQRAAFFRQAVDRARATAGVEAAAAASALPLTASTGPLAVEIEGDREPRNLRAQYNVVTPGYFQAAGIPLLRGRAILDSDSAASPKVVVVSARAAGTLWPGGEAVGKRLRIDNGAWRTVAGVVGDARQDLLRPAFPEFCVPHAQDPVATLSVLVRTRPQPATIGPALRAALRALAPGARIGAPVTMDDVISGYFPGTIVAGCGAFCAVALLVASLGLYGVVAYLAGQRTHEFGVRIALGAAPREIVGLVLQSGFRLVTAGAAIGFAGSLVIGRVLAGVIPGVPPADLAVSAIVCATLAAVALGATAVPAGRAARTDPIAALRFD